ncbi:MAG TPA: T9SS type A sorting domain-containing protein, partial [Bacteroidia bacterium]|nr:T9SS type A sorting domain-containing protein [Bacteroidia bacterium]
VTTTYSVTGTDAMGCTATSAFTVVVNPLPTPIITPDGPLAFCDGGSVNLTANGGTSYLWSTAATTASIPVNTSGTYTVTVTDANTCSATTSEIVTVYPLPTPIITPDGPLAFCDGGSVNLTASGGTSYLWSTSANTASIAISTSGTYTVTVTDVNSCSATTSETVTVYPLPTVTLSPPGPLTICGNSTVTLIANSASAASYVWYQNSAVIISETGSYYTTNSPGSYYVVITDANGCTASSNVVVVTLGNSTINVTVTSSLAGSCNANTIFIGYGPQSATLTANSTGAVAYLWSTGATTQSITVTAAGTYSVTVWDSAGCVSPATPESQITIEVIDIRCGHTLQKILFCHVPVGNPANPQTICIAPQSVPSHLALHPGDCVGPCSLYYRIDNPLNGEDNFIIYPNPFNSSFVIHAFNESETYHLNVYDVTGRLIISETNFTGSVEVAETLSKGVYHVEIISGDNVTVLKVVKL